MTQPPLPKAPDPPIDPGERPPPPQPPPELPWYERLNVLNVTLLLFLLAVVFSAPGVRGSGRPINYWESFSRFAGGFFPPDFSITGETLLALVETFQIAVMATAFAIVFSFPLAVMGAQNISPRWVVGISRMTMNAIRTIPSLIWALIAVAIVGANPLAGVIALTFYSMGYLGKFFSEAFESVDVEIARGLRAIGAGAVQAFQHGLWPHAKPLIWSYSLWMLEYNIRSAAIIGYVGAGGVGVQLYQYQEYYDWQKFATVLLFILAVVTVLDLLGEWVRSRITRKLRKPLAG
ncbi:MAG: phosphonate ABC transporter, permease protein PhnE [Puniceicoccaceae bacterium]|nr:MAG: phosphonate ABC transporter, permease protein PhnE [Puniceicoccaceae bacterium]